MTISANEKNILLVFYGDWDFGIMDIAIASPNFISWKLLHSF